MVDQTKLESEFKTRLVTLHVLLLPNHNKMCLSTIRVVPDSVLNFAVVAEVVFLADIYQSARY